MTGPAPATRHLGVWLRQFAEMPLFGLIGIAGLLFASLPFLQGVLQSSGIPVTALFVLSLIQPLVPLAICVAAGFGLAHPIGLRSWLSDRVVRGSIDLRSSLPVSMLLGTVVFLFMVGVDFTTRSFLPLSSQSDGDMRTLPGFLAALSYGGITEEPLARWE